MADVFFPNSSKGALLRKDRRSWSVANSYALVTIKDPPDLPGEEMAKDARVWKTYVREADIRDKEMIDGRNGTAVFAALFSAISTAFIIESLGDLKPDLTDESAQTLLFMSQTLTAIANNQPAPSPPADTSGQRTFSPSRSAVVVNVLWLLSLSLSVAVSLVAMLAKGWCYNFMSGRSGPIYEQARKRQEKWNGMERWKMTELLVYLPVAMHLALLLFAVGLCVYLWDINVGVAVPVVVITVLATVVYAFATVLPLFDRFCPYNTPIATAFASLHRIAYWTAYSQYTRIRKPKWLGFVFWRLSTWLDPGDAGLDITRESAKDNTTSMDTTTSQMIAWLITNCEDSRSVDIALQAIAGARTELPHASLAQCNSIYLAGSRLQTLTQSLITAHGKLSADELLRLFDALRYGRACVILLSGDSYEAGEDRWRDYSTVAVGKKIVYEEFPILYSTYMNLWDLAIQQGSQTRTPTTVAGAAAMPFCHWEVGWRYPRDHAKLSAAGSVLAPTLQKQLQEHLQGNTIHPSVLHAISASLAHYLVGLWPREIDHEQTALIPILVARVFVTSYGTSPDTARAAAVTLAAAAFASYTYPGGEEPTNDVDTRESRAVSILSHYRGIRLDNEEVSSLFIFGFFSWLPMMLSSGSLVQLAEFNHDLNSIMGDASRAPCLNETTRIWSLPESFSILSHAIGTVSAHSTAATDDTSNEAALASASLLPWFHHYSHIGAYLFALISFCHTESKEHQKLCMQIIAKQGISDTALQELKSIDDKHLLEQLCHSLFSIDATLIPFVALHFGLLVASIIGSGPLVERKSALRPLLSIRDECSSLKVSKSFLYSDLVSYLEETIQNGPTDGTLLRVMQFVVDFCDGSLDDPEIAEPHDWRRWNRLDNLKLDYQSKLEHLEELLAKSSRDTVSPTQQCSAEQLADTSGARSDAQEPPTASPE
ncbi:hypothetical protein FRC09_002722 [Ceratobasidium sp. 395]|nr:hypothetical protein FRC09_002722 [Ceratobasidium sp. 395]